MMDILDAPIRISKRTVTIQEVYDALAKNSFEHLRSSWFGEAIIEDGEIVPLGGCVLAQTAFNLGVCATDANFGMHGSMDIPGLDYNETLYFQLCRIVLEEDNPWFRYGLAETLGGAIIYWNDLVDQEAESDDDLPTYHLKTYAEVTQMAQEVLAKHLDKTITVIEASRNPNDPVTIVPKGNYINPN